MKKKILYACLLGALIGVTISTLITVVISLIVGDGHYYAVVPALASECGSEIAAVTVQLICSLFYGAMWGAASMIWRVERWSLLRMTVTHFAVVCASTFPVAWLLHWMGHDLYSAVKYLCIFVGIYFIIWVAQYSSIKRRVRQLNEKLHEGGAR